MTISWPDVPSSQGMRRIYKHKFGKDLLGDVAESVHYMRRIATLGIAEVIESYHWAAEGVDAELIAGGRRPSEFWRSIKDLDTRTGLRRKLADTRLLVDDMSRGQVAWRAISIRDQAGDAERTYIRHRCIWDAATIAVVLLDRAQNSYNKAEARAISFCDVVDDDPSRLRALKSLDSARSRLNRLQDVVETCTMTAQALNDNRDDYASGKDSG